MRRERLIAAAEELGSRVGLSQACRALGVSRATVYRRHRGPTAGVGSRRGHPRALSPAEREAVLSELHSERFQDQAPAEVYATLLDEGRHLCSERTMYRLLASRDEVRERRNQRRHPSYARPELLATGPNQVWSWDITRLKGPVPGQFFYLYVMLDIYSRYAVGWMVAHSESADNGQRLISTCYQRQSVQAGQLTIHSDRGAPMLAGGTTRLMEALGLTRSRSRPRVSNDNPFSESQFRTLKYHPTFPERFGCFEDARAFCLSFFDWYNDHHRHSGLALFTPSDVHHHTVGDKLLIRAAALERAFAEHPERFVNKSPTPRPPPAAAWINPPTEPPAETSVSSSTEVRS